MKKNKPTKKQKDAFNEEFGDELKYLYWRHKQSQRMEGIGVTEKFGANGQRLGVWSKKNK